MRKLFFLFTCIYTLNTRAQVHHIGLGAGQGDGFDDLKFECFYSFNYKILYTKLNYIFAPKVTQTHFYTHHSMLLVGIQTPDKYKFIAHFALGPRAYFPIKNYRYNEYIYQDYSQVNLFFNAGMSYQIGKHHCIYLDGYLGGIRRTVAFRDFDAPQTQPDFMATIGYAYTFKSKKKSE